MQSGPEALFERYEGLVRRWAPRFDLISPGDLPTFRARHIDDSLRLLPLLDELPPGPCIDVGSGAGLPGIPLAIASERPWRLVEPRQKRAAFLEEVVRQLGLDCEVVAERVEDLHDRDGFAQAHALVTARALAPPAEALALLSPLVAPGGAAALFIGREVDPPPGSRTWAPGVAIFKSDHSEGKPM